MLSVRADNQLPQALAPADRSGASGSARSGYWTRPRKMIGRSGLMPLKNGFVIVSKDADFAGLAVLDPHRVRIV
jgi:hypothetical protein